MKWIRIIFGVLAVGMADAAIPEVGHKWTVDQGGGLVMDFMPITAGHFLMGSNDNNYEKPMHRGQSVSRSGWLGQR